MDTVSMPLGVYFSLPIGAKTELLYSSEGSVLCFIEKVHFIIFYFPVRKRIYP